MKRLIHSLLHCLAAALLLCGCSDEKRIIEIATADPCIRLEVGGEKVFTFDEGLCQMAFSRDEGAFRAFTDDMSDWFSVSLSAVPVSEGETVSGDVSWTTKSGVSTKKSVALKAVRLEGDRIWLRNQQGPVTLVIRVLE